MSDLDVDSISFSTRGFQLIDPMVIWFHATCGYSEAIAIPVIVTEGHCAIERDPPGTNAMNLRAV